MVDFQMWLVRTFARATSVAAMMKTAWGWPAAESIHFIGLCLLVGAIFLFDLRLLGYAKRIPIGALHKLIPWGLTGFAMTAASGVLFVLTEPDQYVYNPSFHFKLLFMVSAGLNALAFYVTSYRRATRPGASADAPPLAKVIAVLSLSLWIGVIVAGRLLTFYRPFPCGPEGPGFLAQCLPNYSGQAPR
jgi:hypothetical protein